MVVVSEHGRPNSVDGSRESLSHGSSGLGDNGRGEVRVAVPPGWQTRTFFVLADQRNVLVRGLQVDDEDLEELFHRVIEESGTPQR